MDKILPPIIYGTAWKKEATAKYVEQAIAAGFTAIDTANQPKHYNEPLVGEALVQIQQQGIKRENIFLQTKFTPADGQDERIPYDPQTDYATQVDTSFNSSLEHLQTSYVDSYLLHGPYSLFSLVDADWQIWGAIEKIYQSGRAKMIGVSNVNKNQLELLVNKAKIKPMIVQNRCYAVQGWDQEVREFCLENSIVYQGFSLLTANSQVVADKKIAHIAQQLNKTPEQIIFRFAIQIGILPLTGTTNEQHMHEDLQINNFELNLESINEIKSLFHIS